MNCQIKKTPATLSSVIDKNFQKRHVILQK